MAVLSNTGIRAGASAAGGSGYEIEKSLRFDEGDGAYLTRTPSSTGDTKKFTYSGWVKKCNLAGTQYLLAAISGGYVFIIGFETDYFYVYNPGAAGGGGVIYSAQKLRDPSAWYHLVVAVDTDQTTDTDRIKMWINNVRVTEYNTADHPSQGATTVFNTNEVPMTIGKYSSSLGSNFYIAEVHYLDGEQLDPSSFGETDSTTGQWVPKKYSGGTASYGTNGFYLKFNDVYDDNGTVKVPDNSGNDNEFEATNILPNQLATVSAATGGLPIYNTSGDYGGTKESGYRTDSSAGTTDGTGLVLAIPGDTTTDVHASINTGSSAKTLSTSGTVSTTTDVSKFYGTSIDLTNGTAFGTTHYWSIAADSDFAFGTGDYTVEWWQKWNDPTTSSGYQSVFCNGYTDTGALLLQSASTEAKWKVFVTGTDIITESTAATVKVWTHYALVRNGTTVTLYRNGAVSGSATNSVSTGLSDHNFLIGRDESGYTFNGYIQDFRVYKGVAKYTSTFTVPQPETLKQDVSNDVPTTFEGTGNGNGNYATWNPVDKGAALTLSQGNLRIASAPNDFVRSTIGMTSGKWYYEEKVGVGDHMIGLANGNADNNYYLGQSHTNGHVALGWYKTNGSMYTYVDTDDYTVTTNSLGTYTTGDVVGVAFDADNGALYFSKNGTWVNSATKAEIAAGTTTNAVVTGVNAGPYFFAAGLDATTADHWANFGQRDWAFPDSIPDGFKALNTYNIADPTIKEPSKHFNTVLYEGDSGSSNAVTGVGFEPDLVWIKNMDNANHHSLFDQVRGDTKVIYGSDPAGEDTISDFSFTSDGFTTDSTDSGYNGAYTYASWNWDAASTDTTKSAGALNSDLYNQAGWVAATTATNIMGGSTLSDIMNGQAGGSFHGGGTSPLILEWDSGTISGNVRLKLRTYGTAAHTYKVAGDSTDHSITVPTLDTFDWYDLGNIDLVEYKGTCPSSGNAAAIEAIELNGKILVDSGQTPTNVPTIATTYRANPEAGFSIINYTGTVTAGTVAHGLNATPDFVIAKNRAANNNWVVYHSGLSDAHTLYLDGNAVQGSDATIWPSTDHDSNVVQIGAAAVHNGSGQNQLMYAWSEVAGYSKFGTYRGTELADPSAAFVYCGFRPAWIMVKNRDAAENWLIWDNKRDGYNPVYKHFEITPVSAQNATTNDGVIDILSNGFKIKVQYSPNNANTYVFAAFAESPFKYANAV